MVLYQLPVSWLYGISTFCNSVKEASTAISIRLKPCNYMFKKMLESSYENLKIELIVVVK